MERFASIVVLIIIGVIIANLVARASQTATLINSVQGLWKESINGLLGQTS